MSAAQVLVDVGCTLLAGAVAFGVGHANFSATRRSVTRLFERGGWRCAIVSTVLRVAGIALLFTLAARLGLASLIAAFVGFDVARRLAVRSFAEAR